MDDKRIKKVIDSYDNINDVRNEYLNSDHYDPFYKIVLDVAPIILIVFIILVFKINLGLIIFLTILFCVLHIVIFFFKKSNDYQVMICYLNTLKSFGFNSIKKYEEYYNNKIIGKGGYCEQLIDYYKEQYSLDEKASVISDLEKRKYYIWCDEQFLYLLNCQVMDIVSLKKIRLNDVFYYRKTKYNTVLKVRLDVFYFDIFAYDVFVNLLPTKKIEMITNYEPDKYITDFELYMHVKKNDYSDKNCNFGNFFAKLFGLYMIFVGIYLCNLFFDIPNNLIMKLVMTLIVCIMCIITGEMTDYYSRNTKLSLDELNKIINLDKTQMMFKELKVALNIDDSFDTLYTPVDAPYLCWVRNGYFHVFLNQIYYNCVYMVIAVRDIEYYYLNDEGEVVLKTKVKDLTFRNDMKKMFDKILPNKDYAWLNNLKK